MSDGREMGEAVAEAVSERPFVRLRCACRYEWETFAPVDLDAVRCGLCGKPPVAVSETVPA